MSTPPTDNIPQSPTEVKSNQPQNATETAKGKPANVKNYGTAPEPMQTQEQVPQIMAQCLTRFAAKNDRTDRNAAKQYKFTPSSRKRLAGAK